VHFLPAAIAFVAALGLAPLLLGRLRAAGLVAPNYRGVSLPVPLGLLIVPAGLVALVPVTLLARLADSDIYPDNFGLVMVLIPGVALLGLIDDVLSGASRGWRGHGAALISGDLSTGALKAIGTLALALLVASGLPGDEGEFLLAAGVIVLATNVFNLLDLRPGRAVKSFVLLGIGVSVSTALTEPIATIGIFAAPVLVAGFFDLREKAMLGDTGSNVIGALAGLWLVLTLDTDGQVIALVVLLVINVVGEFTSISAFIEKVPGLRHLDSLGRPS
jgi:UDP-N-acetylmuramyl pentapeptide phosphotransferase/UDP-N-acetylglucosamine-1-phosphate transferase